MIYTMHKGNSLVVGEVDKIVSSYGKSLIQCENSLDLEPLSVTPKMLSIVDECNNEWERVGNVYFTRTNVKFAYGMKIIRNSGYFRTKNALTYGGADFCLECYSYIESVENFASFISTQSTLNTHEASRPGQFTIGTFGNHFYIGFYNSSGKGADYNDLGIDDIYYNLNHIALCYTHHNTTVKIYLNGKLQYTNTDFNVERLSRYIYVGAQSYYPHDYNFTGTIDEVRISDGTCRYDSEFTPPDTRFIKDNKTLILLHCDY